MAPTRAEPVADLAVVASAESPLDPLTRQQIADLFLGKRQIRKGGRKLVPIDVADERVRAAFYERIAAMSLLRLNAYWARRVFSGKGRPPRKLPPDRAIMRLRSQPMALTYLPRKDTEGLKILFILPASEKRD